MDNQQNQKVCCARPMNFGGLFFGLMTVFFGLFFLAKNSGFLEITIPTLTLEGIWPLFFIFAGLSILTAKNIFIKILGAILTLIVAVLCIVLILYRPVLEYSPSSALNGVQNEVVPEIIEPL
jgi:hypothetical protein